MPLKTDEKERLGVTPDVPTAVAADDIGVCLGSWRLALFAAVQLSLLHEGLLTARLRVRLHQSWPMMIDPG